MLPSGSGRMVSREKWRGQMANIGGERVHIVAVQLHPSGFHEFSNDGDTVAVLTMPKTSGMYWIRPGMAWRVWTDEHGHIVSMQLVIK